MVDQPVRRPVAYRSGTYISASVAAALGAGLLIAKAVGTAAGNAVGAPSQPLAIAVSAIAALTGVAASVLVLRRSRLSVPALTASLALAVVEEYLRIAPPHGCCRCCLYWSPLPSYLCVPPRLQERA